LLICFVCSAWIGCATRPLPRYEPPLPRAKYQYVHTAAYTHFDEHGTGEVRTAKGTRFQSGAINSAAADWSRWPIGTLFRVAATGELFEVDDYGWVSAGTNRIELYKPTAEAMRIWGTRQVTIEIVRWGDIEASRRILLEKGNEPHVRRMLKQIESGER
jgi:3D (Asp-Asp-Asp) domain-containing protein